MAPKSKGGNNADNLQQEDILQAVVFADSFTTRFFPISLEKPRTLLPVVNVPLLEYTLEFLASGGVQEIFVFCCHHADHIKEHLRNSRWTETGSPCRVVPVVVESCLSMGDALRDIDAKSLIHSDFVLLYGDVISNMKLQTIVEEHKQRREKDKTTIMTMVLREAPPGHVTRCREEDVVLAIDNDTNNVIHYQKLGYDVDPDGVAKAKRSVDFPIEVLTEHKDVRLRYDLLDPNISICSPQVPQLFTDNFDYQTRDDFVRGILINEEIMGNTVQLHVVTDAYAARVSNLHMYDAVSRDILNRWTFPYVPDNCYRHHRDTISYGRHNIYLSKDVTLARGCDLKESVIVGGGTCIGADTQISHSVIGRNCKIGRNVKIEGAYIWDGVTIEDNSTLSRCLLCGGVTVYSNTTVSAGSVLSWNVAVGPKFVIKDRTVAVSSPVEDDFGDKDTAAVDSGGTSCEFGSNSKAYPYKCEVDSDDEDWEVNMHMCGLSVKSDSVSSVSDVDAESISPPPSPTPGGFQPEFYVELLGTLQRAQEENVSIENLKLEINSLKHAYAVSIKVLVVMVVKGLIEQPMSDNPSCDVLQAIKVIKENLTRYLLIVQNYVNNTETQTYCLQAIEEFGCSGSHNMLLVMKIIHFLYDADILVEQEIVRWHRKQPDDSDDCDSDIGEDKHIEIRKQVAPLIKWLEEADEESSEESDD